MRSLILLISVLILWGCSSKEGSSNKLLAVDQTQGYRYYKFEVNATDLGGPYECILTETCFMDGDAMVTDGYKVLNHSPVYAGDTSTSTLFNGSDSAGKGHVKTITIPWHWVVDMGASYKFTSMFISSWETFFYHEPSQVTIYGSDDASTWIQIGDKTFTSIYQSAFVPLTY